MHEMLIDPGHQSRFKNGSLAERLTPESVKCRRLLDDFQHVRDGVVPGGSDVTSKPHIILVMPDDVGYGDYACLGNPIMRTPSVDARKKESLLFTQFHVSPFCPPTRSALMSGRHEFKNGVTHTIRERERMSLKTFTLPQMLKTAGYRYSVIACADSRRGGMWLFPTAHGMKAAS